MSYTKPVTDLIASNLTIAAPIVAFVAAWVIYGVLGKRFLGADDDFWPKLRGWVLPKLDQIGQRSSLYAAAEVGESEYVGRIHNDLDAVEQQLAAMRYRRNPLSSYKTTPEGWKSDGSWAKRSGYVRGSGDVIRAASTSFPIPGPGWLVGTIGRFLQGLGDVAATRQDHVMLFERETPTGDYVVHVYAHHEPNSLNPLTAFAHYMGHGWNGAKGVRRVRDDFSNHGVAVETPAGG